VQPKPIKKEKLAFDDAEALQALCGSNNGRLKLIERTAGAQVNVRGNEITIEGEPEAAAVAKDAVEQLYDLALTGRPLSSDDVVRAVKMIQGDGNAAAVQTVFGDTILTPRAGRPIAPKGKAQKDYVDLVRGNDVVFAVGPAGTGKTYLAVALAVRALLDRQIKRIILTRPAIEAGERLGFLPGTLEEKIDPYLRPLHDALHDMLDGDRLDRFLTDGTIEIAPLAFMRGRTLSGSFIILDEAQNTTPEQMKMFLTRLGFSSKIVVTGDITQVDLPGAQRSGLKVVREILDGVEDVHFSMLTSADVVRHKLVADIVDAYERWQVNEDEAEVHKPRTGNARRGR
jgi:phosphate starvation-inducible PhoH-like protein